MTDGRLDTVLDCTSKVKVISVQPWTHPGGSRRLRLPNFKTMGHEGGTVVSPTHRPPLPLRKYSWYSFLLGTESNPGRLYVWYMFFSTGHLAFDMLQ